MYNETRLRLEKEAFKGIDNIVVDCRLTPHLKRFLELHKGDYDAYCRDNPINVMEDLSSWRLDDFISINIIQNKLEYEQKTILQRIGGYIQKLFGNCQCKK